MMPTVAASTDVAAEALARTMRARSDIRVPDIDLAAWTVTHATIGVFHTLIWEEDPPPMSAVRTELVAMISGYLSGDHRPGVAPTAPTSVRSHVARDA